MSEIQIDYTSRDYAALKADLISLVSYNTGKNWEPSDPSDLGNVLIEAFAYMGDIMSYYIDRAANETNVITAAQTSTLLGFAQLYGFKPSGPTPAIVNIQFTNTSSNTVDLPVGTQVMAPLTYGPYSQAYFETTVGYTAIQPGQVITVAAQEGQTVNTDKEDFIDQTYRQALPANIGTSDGTANQNLVILDTNIIDASLVVYVGQGVAFAPWTYVDTLLEYGPTDLVFTTQQNPDETLTIIFGDGINGSIPPSGQLISSTYKTSVGIYGNIVSNAITELSFIPGNVDPEATTYFSVTNPTAAVGGADRDSTSALRDKIRAAIISRRRAVTLADYNYIATQVSGVGKANAAAAVYSLVNIYVQPQDDGSTTPGLVSGITTSNWNTLAANVTNYMADKIPVGVTVNILPPAYVPVYLGLNVSINSTYRQNVVKLAVFKSMLDISTGLFAYVNNSFGRSVSLSSIISAVSQLDGVTSVNVTQCSTDGTSTVSSIVLSPNQIPYLLAANLSVTITGGINL